MRHDKKMVNELAHYLQSGVSKGGQENYFLLYDDIAEPFDAITNI